MEWLRRILRAVRPRRRDLRPPHVSQPSPGLLVRTGAGDYLPRGKKQSRRLRRFQHRQRNRKYYPPSSPTPSRWPGRA